MQRQLAAFLAEIGSGTLRGSVVRLGTVSAGSDHFPIFDLFAGSRPTPRR
jgi:hypothetical protein